MLTETVLDFTDLFSFAALFLLAQYGSVRQ
jgi:hypothetical protein